MKTMTFAALAVAAAAALVGHAVPSAAEAARRVPAPAVDQSVTPGVQAETAVLAGGCFWGVQGVFQHVKGVSGAVSGYAGGAASTAHYEDVGTGRTGHAESVRITFDPQQISYGRLLQIYFSVAHDPTELNRQGPDSGTQYRSTIFPASAEQARVARAYIAQLDQTKTFGQSVATTLEAQKTFYPAEPYHQDYLVLHPQQPYIVINDLPKVDALRRLFPESYRPDAVRVSAAGTQQQ